MPLYEYVCRECRHGFEALVLGADVPTCPQCSATTLERVLSVVAIGRSGASGRSSTGGREAAAPNGGCGSCGDPRGPGACALD